MKIVTFLANGFEESEAIIVVDILRRASITVEMASINENLEVISSHQIRVIADKKFNEINSKDFDAVFLPGGGGGVKNFIESASLAKVISDFYKANKTIIAICAAPTFLEKLGIIKGKNITLYPDCIKDISSAKCINEKVVIDGQIITSQGFGTAIDLGLKLIEKFISREKALELKDKIVYN